MDRDRRGRRYAGVGLRGRQVAAGHHAGIQRERRGRGRIRRARCRGRHARLEEIERSALSRRHRFDDGQARRREVGVRRGVVGRVAAINDKDDTFVLETTSDRVKIRFRRSAISSVEKLDMGNTAKDTAKKDAPAKKN